MDAEEAAVLATLHELLDAFTRRDKPAMLQTMMTDGAAVHSRDGQVSRRRLQDITDRLPPENSTHEERLHDPLIRVDDDIAMAWAPYDYFADGELSHWGTNIVTFLKIDGRWLVSGIADNGRTTPKPID